MSDSAESELGDCQRICSECGGTYYLPTCDPCLAESMLERAQKFERIARERKGGAFNPAYRRLAFDLRKDMRELELAKYV